MQQLLQLQAKQAEEANKLAKEDKFIQLAQVYQEHAINKDGDLEVAKLIDVDNSVKEGTSAVKQLSEKIAVTKADEQLKQTTQLNENLKSLKEVIKDNIKLSIKNGGGDKIAKGIQNAEAERPQSKLKTMLFGSQSKEDVKNASWTTKLGFKKSPTMALYDWVDNKEKKQARAKEKEAFVESAIKNDKRGIALKNLKGEDYAREDAGKRFEAIKAKEAEIANVQKTIDEQQAAGYNPKKKDVKARDALAAEVAEMDPRRRKDYLAEPTSKKEKTEKTEDQAEAETSSAKAAAAMVATEGAIGSTLIQSLETHKQQLETLGKILVAMEAVAENGGGGGGGLLSAAADVASSVGKKGMGKVAQMGSKAAGFLGKHAGKIGAIGGVAMGAYDAYSGWSDANDKLAAGEITQDQANVQKSEAVGGGVGGAGGALAGAAAGAAIGSVVPVVGTAIGGVVGGALGYMGGSAIGSKVGGALTEGYQGVRNFFGGKPKEQQPVVTSSSKEQYLLADEPVEKGKPLSQNQMAVAEMKMKMGNKLNPLEQEAYDLAKQAKVSTPNLTEPAVASGSKANEEIKADTVNGGGSATVVNAPTNVTNNNSSAPAPMRSPIRNQESSVSKYINSRFAM